MAYTSETFPGIVKYTIKEIIRQGLLRERDKSNRTDGVEEALSCKLLAIRINKKKSRILSGGGSGGVPRPLKSPKIGGYRGLITSCVEAIKL